MTSDQTKTFSKSEVGVKTIVQWCIIIHRPLKEVFQMLTIIPKGLTIIAGGCRYPASDGKVVEKYCNDCNTQGKHCELEPHARNLAEVTLSARGKTDVIESRIEVKTGFEW